MENTKTEKAEKKKLTARVILQEALATDVFSMWIEAKEVARTAKPGQFLSLYTKDASRLLPRPISICEADPDLGRLRVVYRVAGAGTEEFSHCRAGDAITVMGPLGNGFPFKRAEGKRALLVGGGIGIPPMLGLAKAREGENLVVLGFRDQLFLHSEFQPYGKVYVATEDGSAGTRGNVLDLMEGAGLTADVVYACGPTPMLRAVKAYAARHGMECWLSLEEKMACGIGACLACVCNSREVDSHSNVHNKRICKDGPVFLAQEVEL